MKDVSDVTRCRTINGFMLYCYRTHTHRGTFIATPTHSHAKKEKETTEYTLPNQNHRTPTNPNPSSNDQHPPEPAG